MKTVSCIAERLKEYRTLHNYSFTDMANLTGIPAQTLNRYELGQRSPKLDTAISIAEALNVNPMWLFGYDVPPTEKKPATNNDGRSGDIINLYGELTADNRSKLLELGHLFLDAQHKSE